MRADMGRRSHLGVLIVSFTLSVFLYMLSEPCHGVTQGSHGSKVSSQRATTSRPPDRIPKDSVESESLVSGEPSMEKPLSHEELKKQLDGMLKIYNKYLEIMGKISRPLAQKVESILKDPEFSKFLDYIVEYTDWVVFGIAQAVLVVGMIIFRAWRLSRVRNWFARLWVSFWTLCFYLFLSILFVPFLVIGRPFLDILKLIITHFRA